jgi:hypothetical protein
MQIDIIGIAIAAFIGGWVVLVNLFAAVMHAKAILDRGEKLPKVFLYPLYVGAVVGLILDVAFNWTLGILIYSEAPREFTFSSRTQRHVDQSHGEQKRRAVYWAHQMNKFDQNHIRLDR